MVRPEELADELGEGDGTKPRTTKDDLHYSEKGSHGIRHENAHTERELEKLRRKQKKRDNGQERF